MVVDAIVGSIDISPQSFIDRSPGVMRNAAASSSASGACRLSHMSLSSVLKWMSWYPVIWKMCFRSRCSLMKRTCSSVRRHCQEISGYVSLPAASTGAPSAPNVVIVTAATDAGSIRPITLRHALASLRHVASTS